jgi:curli biogenesis system outer membrane secretion channel CsgG
MRRLVLSVFVMLAFFSIVSSAQAPTPAKSAPATQAKPATPKPAPKPTVAKFTSANPNNQELIDFAQRHVSEKFLLDLVKKATGEKREYDLKNSELLILMDAGVPESVIEAIRAPSAPAMPTTASVTPSVNSAPAVLGGKLRVVVRDFNFGTASQAATPQVNVASGGKNQPIFDVSAIGQGLSNLVSNELGKTGEVRILSRSAMEAVKQEQELAGNKASTGQILSAQYIITGSITKFGPEDKNMNIGAIAAGHIPLVGGMFGSKKSIQYVGLSLQIADVVTSENLKFVDAEGKSLHKSIAFEGLGVGSGGGAAGGAGFGSSNFQQSAIGEASLEAAKVAAKQLVAAFMALKIGE